MSGFRVWDTVRGKMHYEYFEGANSVKMDGVLIDEHGSKSHHNYIPMQSTGLLDENKKEIYQKDIVKFEIIDSNVAFAHIVQDLFDFYHFYYILERPFNVYLIGNVYQNVKIVNDVLRPRKWKVNGGKIC